MFEKNIDFHSKVDTLKVAIFVFQKFEKANF